MSRATERSVVPANILALPEFRYLMGSVVVSSLAGRALALVIGYQIYELTKNPLALGWLGLVEAIPSVSLALFGGYVADRSDRRSILLITGAVSVLCALLFAYIARDPTAYGINALYVIIFIAGIARGFANPASSAFYAQVIPQELAMSGSAWLSSVWQVSSIVGPTLGGFAYAWLGASNTYGIIALLLALSWLCMWAIAARPKPVPVPGESIFQSIAVGVRYVLHNQALIGSMSLDLFAVLFGGAMALLPIFASDILAVGPRGLGILAAAPSLGALVVMLWSTRYPPKKNAGRNLLLCVAGFGLSIIVFALSRNFVLSCVALAFSGLFDGVSMVIRDVILRLHSPENMRGRIAAVSWIFIGSSNEIGAFESGVAASLLGTARSVWLGGVVTLLVVAATTILAPKLRKLDLDVTEPL